jgi:hypothetical protein
MPPPPTGQNAGWDPKPVWILRREKPCQCQDSNPSHPTCSPSPYWVSYHNSQHSVCADQFILRKHFWGIFLTRMWNDSQQKGPTVSHISKTRVLQRQLFITANKLIYLPSQDNTCRFCSPPPVYNTFLYVNLLHVSLHKRPSSGKHKLLAPSIGLRGYIYRSITIIIHWILNNIKLLNT